MADVLTINRQRAVVTLTLNRPDKRNALNFALVAELKATLRRLASDDAARVIVLTGAGSVFSAGADLAALQALQSASPQENLDDSDHLAELFQMLYLHPKPVIAKVNGHAIAGGCGLAAVCDYAIAAEKAKVGFTEVQIGFVPAIVAVFILRKMGETRAREVLLGGKLYTAAEGAAMDLLTQAVPADERWTLRWTRWQHIWPRKRAGAPSRLPNASSPRSVAPGSTRACVRPRRPTPSPAAPTTARRASGPSSIKRPHRGSCRGAAATPPGAWFTAR